MTSIRPAVAADSPAVTGLAIAAFERYTERIGRPAMPMTLDYAAAVDEHKIWLAEAERPPLGLVLLGFVLLEEQADALLLDVIAVSPDAQGQGWAAVCSPSSKSRLGPAATRGSCSTPTRR